MKLYAGTTELVRADAGKHRIEKKLRAESTTQIVHRPAPSDDQAELSDQGVIGAYQLGNTCRRRST